MPYETYRVNMPTAFACEDNGVWTTAPTGTDGLLDLVYIKTRNTPNNHVEVHIASASSAYQEFSEHAVSGFACQPEGCGTWSMVDTTGDGHADLVYIKTRSATSTMEYAEVHIALASSRFAQVLPVFPTKLKADSSGTWALSPKYVGDWTQGDDWRRGLWLSHIRHTGTQSGFVEVETCLSGNFTHSCGVVVSKFPVTKPGYIPRTYTMCEIQSPGWRYGITSLQVVCIDHHTDGRKGSAKLKVDISHADQVSNGKAGDIHGPYETVLARRNTGVWQLAYHLVSLGNDYTTTTDIVHIKHINTRSGKVELAIVAGNPIEDKDWLRKVTDVATKIPKLPTSKLKFWINEWSMNRDGIRPKKELRSRSDNAFVRIYQTVVW